MNTLGEKLLSIRKSKGYSQEKLAEEAKINLRTLQRIEKGKTKPHGETLTRICNALDISVEEVVNNKQHKAPYYLKLFALSILILCSIVFLYSQFNPSTGGDKVLITKRIHYEIPIGSTDLEYGWINIIHKQDRVAFIKELFDRAYSGKVKTCDIYMNPIGPEELKAQLADSLFMILMRNVPPFEEFDTCILRYVNPEEIDCLGFQEEWTYNSDDMVIAKRVLGICPIITVNKLHQDVYRPLFWIYFDDALLNEEITHQDF